MDLKRRFASAIALILTGSLAVFSLVVFTHTRQNLTASARQRLAEHVQHERQHLELADQGARAPSKTLHGHDIHYRALRDGQPIYDTIPSALESALGPGLVENRGVALVERIDESWHGHRYQLVGVLDMAVTNRYLSALRNDLLLTGAAAALFLIPLSLFLTRLLLVPFKELAVKTRELTAEKLSFRFPQARNRDEYGTLVESFNALLGRLDDSFRQVRRFATNASHELRTPITVIRGEAEVMLRKPRDVSDYEDALRRIVTQSDALQSIVRRLLFLANLERMEQEPQNAELEVVGAVNEKIEVLAKLYESKRPRVECFSPEAILFPAHAELFSSVVTNLLENAFKYSAKRIEISLATDPQKLTVTVDDDGPGIPDALKGQVFQPFFRIMGRGSSAGDGGHGLGLSIVKACVEACRGAVRLLDSPLGGLRVEVTLPRPVAV